jgi:uncharacterized repeat protein (TIGR03803 family)
MKLNTETTRSRNFFNTARNYFRQQLSARLYLPLLVILASLVLPERSSAQVLYGTTTRGGAYDQGVIFEYNVQSGIYTKKFDFDGINGVYPNGGMIKASNGKLYGVTRSGGLYDFGVLYEFDPVTTTFTRKVDFNYSNGREPRAALVEAGGKLYSTTSEGGTYNEGVLFEYDLSTSTLVKRYDFGLSNGSRPHSGVIVVSDKLLGVAMNGGSTNSGVLYEYDLLTSTYAKKFDFGAQNGKYPHCTLTMAANGKLYGTALEGGANGFGVLFEYDMAASTYTKKVDFTGANGQSPDPNGTAPIGGLQHALWNNLSRRKQRRRGVV